MQIGCVCLDKYHEQISLDFNTFRVSDFCIPKDEDLDKSDNTPKNSKLKWKKAVKTIKLDPFQLNKKSFQKINQKD